jgi:hypothetical protein
MPWSHLRSRSYLAFTTSQVKRQNVGAPAQTLNAALEALADHAPAWSDGRGTPHGRAIAAGVDTPLGLAAPREELLNGMTSEELRGMLVALAIKPPRHQAAAHGRAACPGWSTSLRQLPTGSEWASHRCGTAPGEAGRAGRHGSAPPRGMAPSARPPVFQDWSSTSPLRAAAPCGRSVASNSTRPL